MTGDFGVRAAAIRIKAARMAAGLPTQKALADALGFERTTNISNAEKGDQFPNREVMNWLFMEKRIDFNFLMGGQYNQLPEDVQDALFPALESVANEWERTKG